MTINKPTVSVIMATYNHENYVKQAIQSVLSQKDIDFEFLIADDGSADQTREVVASISDSRISFFPYTENRGAGIVTNELIKRASGEFIALINSDDYWIDSDKLAYQVKILKNNTNIGACFGQAKFVDQNGLDINKSLVPHGNVFNQKNRSRSAWLRYFFDSGNCICHPTMLIRKACYEELGMYDNRLRQLPDFDMWIRLVKHYDIYISDIEMIAFRYLPGENASSGTASNFRRIYNEMYFILEDFFDGIPQDIFIDGFGDLLIKTAPLDDYHMTIEQSLLYLGKNRWASHIYNQICLDKIYYLLDTNNAHRKILINEYNIDDRNFHKMSAEICAFDSADLTSSLSAVDKNLLIHEIKQRIIRHIPRVLQPITNKILK